MYDLVYTYYTFHMERDTLNVYLLIKNEIHSMDYTFHMERDTLNMRPHIVL
jgi:hypothetical protein